MDATDKIGYIKCPQCDSEFYTDDLAKLHYKCTHCGNDITILYYCYCPECDKNVGIQEKHLSLRQFGSDCVETFKLMLRPRRLIKSIVEENSLPLGNHYVCPLCKTRYAVCPHCGTRTDGNHSIKAGEDEVMFCTGCGNKFIIYGYDE